MTYTPPLFRLSVPLVKGKIWTQQVTVDGGTMVFQRKVEVLGFETVTVTAGTFACAKLRLTNSTIGGSSVVVDEWWSEKVGLIKSTAYQDLQLVSFVQAP